MNTVGAVCGLALVLMRDTVAAPPPPYTCSHLGYVGGDTTPNNDTDGVPTNDVRGCARGCTGYSAFLFAKGSAPGTNCKCFRGDPTQVSSSAGSCPETGAPSAGWALYAYTPLPYTCRYVGFFSSGNNLLIDGVAADDGGRCGQRCTDRRAFLFAKGAPAGQNCHCYGGNPNAIDPADQRTTTACQESGGPSTGGWALFEYTPPYDFRSYKCLHHGHAPEHGPTPESVRSVTGVGAGRVDDCAKECVDRGFEAFLLASDTSPALPATNCACFSRNVAHVGFST